ncbi:glycine betaine ABC transporter substrate-binding protein [Halomonas denitrificans]|uniref:glycine betaine ABC transporter substrate-binding protein n=1 Tax=Halomonas denitrificans TaxID=370769 RepID=UPI000D3BDC87|nr:glycine betaine ABC transporter substrate-binding protein [Halomonas denitrificans]
MCTKTRSPLTLIHGLGLVAGLALSAPALATDRDDQLRLVVPPWPGVTVKSEILAQLITPLGYRAEALELSSTVGYSTLQSGDSDAFLAGWLPAQQESYDAAMAADAIVDLGNNVTGARMGFAVPGYVAEAGITDAAQLADPEVAEHFDRTIYSIESGSTVTDMIEGAIENDTHGLDGWELKASSTPGMLSEVRAAVAEEQWILFYGWTPHWMVPEYDVHILDDAANVFGADSGRSDVKTIVAREYAEANPNLARLLDQFTLSAAEQSEFIRAYSLEERDVEDVAREWLTAHPERVAAFLEGVKTRDGDDALAAVEARL